MPITKGDKGIIIHRDLVQPLQTWYEVDQIAEGIRGRSFQRYVNEILKDWIDKREFLKERFPMLWHVAIQENRVILKDSKKNMYVDVHLSDGTLYCDADKTDDCIHVHFVLAMPELGRLRFKNKV